MFIPESNKIPEEIEISMDLRTLLQFYKAPEAMLADILLIDEATVKKTETQKNSQIADDMLFRLWRFAVKNLHQLEERKKKNGKLTSDEELLERCTIRLEKATDKEINRRTMI